MHVCVRAPCARMCVCVREMHVMHVRVQTHCATVHVRVQTHNAFSLHSVWEIACDVYVRVHVHVRVRACVCASAAAIFGLVPSRRSAAPPPRGPPFFGGPHMHACIA